MEASVSAMFSMMTLLSFSASPVASSSPRLPKIREGSIRRNRTGSMKRAAKAASIFPAAFLFSHKPAASIP